MNKPYFRSSRYLLTPILVATLVACGGSDNNDNDDSNNESPTQSAPPGETQQTSIGTVFKGTDDLTLYTFENDRNDSDGDGVGDSDCNDSCAETWPPYIPSDTDTATGQFDIITRDDGTTRQWTFKGLPLYFFAGDAAAGDVQGNGVSDVWYVARPDPWAAADVDDLAQGTVFVGANSVLGVDGSGGQSASRANLDGFTLYTFENDRNDSDGDGIDDSDCNGACAETWPPLFADPGATAVGNFSIINRDDGSRQWAFSGLPLYFYAPDSAPGDTLGEGIGSVWYVARPNPFGVAESTIGTVLVGLNTVVDVDTNGDKGTQRVDRDGFTLYVFDNDRDDSDGDGVGDSDCNSNCAVTWPPLFADAGATAVGQYSIIDRDDGTRQWAFKGEPLYFFANDLAVGDANGDQVGGVWHAARPAPVQLFNDSNLGNIFAARGDIANVDNAGDRSSTQQDKTGFSVYLFDDDTNDVDGDGADSDCNDGCAVTWPPLYAEESDVNSGNFTIIEREDGSRQWVYRGSPLYFFSGDSAVGDVNGVYGTWHEVEP